MSQLIVNHDLLTRVGIELLGQLKIRKLKGKDKIRKDKSNRADIG